MLTLAVCVHRSATDPADNWYDYTYVLGGTERESYWNHPVGVDQGEPSAGVYALHRRFVAEGLPRGVPCSLERDVLPVWIAHVIRNVLFSRIKFEMAELQTSNS